MKRFVLLLLAMSFSAQWIFAQKEHVDLIIYDAKIYTVNEKFEVVNALAVKDGRFVAVGDKQKVRRNYSADRIYDAEGACIYPGFNDGHSHFLGYGINRTQFTDLRGTKSPQEVIERLQQHQQAFPSHWVMGRGWDQNDWQTQQWPSKEMLDRVFPDQPVLLTRVDGHAVWVNSVVLNMAKIDARTQVEGGEVVIENGQPTGVLIDNAIGLVRGLVPELGKAKKVKALLKAQEDCFAAGLTTVSDAGLDKNDILLIDSLQQAGKLKIRIYAMLNPTSENFEFFFLQGPWHKERLTVSSVKIYVDGALGSRGALLLKPYADDPGNLGLQIHPLDYYRQICNRAYQAGFQVNTHAIGDSGNRVMLKTYAEFLKTKNDRRWRVEHAQVVAPEDLHYFADFSIIPSVQSTHCTSDMYWAGDRLGPERIHTAYAYADLLRQNGWLVNGTDFPVEGIDPLRTFYAAVARKDAAGWPENGFQTENALSREEALRSITIWPAKGSFDENEKGSIEVDKQADFVILSDDLMKKDEEALLKIRVVATFVGGDCVYKKMD